MTAIFETRDEAEKELYILTYAHYMAQTARTEAAKQMFETFLKQEKQWLEANGGIRSLSESGNSAPEIVR